MTQISPPDCDNDIHSDSDSSSPNEAPKGRRCKAYSRFSEACLNSYYSNGMTFTSRKHHLIISKAAKDTDLTVAQVILYNNSYPSWDVCARAILC